MKTNQDALEAFNKWMDSAGCLEQSHFDNGDIRIELARSADTIRRALIANTWRDELIKHFEELQMKSTTVNDMVYLDGVIAVIKTFEPKPEQPPC